MNVRRWMILAFAANALLAIACAQPGAETDRPVAAERSYTAVEGKAILVRGSASVKGLPFLGQNAIPALTGVYALPAADGKTTFEVPVWYSAEPVLLPAGWVTIAFPGLPAGHSVSGSPPGQPPSGLPPEIETLLAVDAGSYRLFIGLPRGTEVSTRFVAVLSERFAWFRQHAMNPADISFPAVLEIGR